MQIFLPFPDIYKSLACLDRVRLCKQRVEVRQLINIHDGYKPAGHWAKHPILKMTCGYLEFIIDYYNKTLTEFEDRGYHNIKLHRIPNNYGTIYEPWWFGDSTFHLSHQANLLRKAIDDASGIAATGKPKRKSRELLDKLAKHGIMESTVDKNLPYYWPVR